MMLKLKEGPYRLTVLPDPVPVQMTMAQFPSPSVMQDQTLS